MLVTANALCLNKLQNKLTGSSYITLYCNKLQNKLKFCFIVALSIPLRFCTNI